MRIRRLPDGAEDLASYQGAIEEPLSVEYRGSRVYKCGPWTQGPVFLQQLRLLEGFDLAAAGHNSADALHVWLECAKLAFADREACYADPAFASTCPMQELLSDPYTDKRRALIDPERASLELRPGLGRLAGWLAARRGVGAGGGRAAGLHRATRPWRHDARRLRRPLRQPGLRDAERRLDPVVAGGARARLPDRDARPDVLARPGAPQPRSSPGKRPRTTLTPSLARLADGRLLAFGTPGGDQQDQWTLQMFLNLVDFGMRDLQEAIDAPTLHSRHMPSSFYPSDRRAGCTSPPRRGIPRRTRSRRSSGAGTAC